MPAITVVQATIGAQHDVFGVVVTKQNQFAREQVLFARNDPDLAF
ncbi:MAG TPA: hypothetical protein VE640_01520 [Candidatus Bathyarchaeia archaeon]|jgi:hypothetical protein|nr:hypothetical protein [Candidatus Bathyarchaeia archaeon]